MKLFFITAIFCACIFSAKAQKKDTIRKVEFIMSEEQMGRLWQILATSRNFLLQTEIPAKTIVYCDSMIAVMVQQSYKWHPEMKDSTNKK